MTELGRLEKLNLRDVWASEPYDFTPWLAKEDNLALLSEALGLELELEAVEHNVGVFKADILCKDVGSGNWVLIENQLARTDHTHLGQLITYAAGLDAVTIVWIAARIADEHRAAVDWLNEKTEASVQFFALEVELWRIGDSPAAPRFNIVSMPNNWTRTAARAKSALAEGELSLTRKIALEYWAEVEDRIAETVETIKPVTPLAQSWIGHGIGRTGASLNMVVNFRDNRIRVEIYLSGPLAKSRFDQLFDRRAEVETALGHPLSWQRLDGTDSRVCIYRDDSDPSDREAWPAQHAWLVSNLAAFDRTFRPILRTLD